MKYLEIENIVNNNQYFNITQDMYNIFTKDIFDKEIIIHKEFKPLIDILYNIHGQKYDKCTLLPNINNTSNIKEENNNVLLGFSGGLDSCYLAFKLKDKGYNVSLFHLKGLNKNYPKEDEFAVKFATNHNFNLININVKHLKKQFFPDNPLKNQLILSLMVDYGLENNICKFALGADYNTDIKDASIGFTITDSIQVTELYLQGLRNTFKSIELLLIPNDEPKSIRLKYLVENQKNVLQDIYSCIIPHRFNNSLHNKNQEKFGVVLLDGRCGSCYKCCQEILILSELGYFYNKNKNIDLINHCWKILSDSKTSHRKDLFNKKIDIRKRTESLMSYGS